MLKTFAKIAAAAALLTAVPALAQQIQTVDPNQSTQDYPEWQNEPSDYPEWQSGDTPSPPQPDSDWTPIETERTQVTPPRDAYTPPADRTTVPREDVFTAAESVFGRGTEGLAGIIENILRDRGEPSAYISGQEASGAFVFGVRYGSGVMRHQIEGDRTVYWTGPSLGFDAGADANKVFILVYNLHDGQELFRRYPGAEGNAYFVGGFTAQYMRRGDVVLIPVRLGVGLRLGVNAGYMRFSERNRWLPF
ncbi:MAG: DUF1134 domain-containing protein [Sphingomonas sp.]|nr:DUF1134 domain-containing protein [Sphingomonas sp.]